MFVGTAKVPIDPTSEGDTITFDFAPGLAAGESINGVSGAGLIAGTTLGVTCTSIGDNASLDSTPAVRVLSSPVLGPSPSTGVANQAVLVLVGNMVAGVLYQLTVVVKTTGTQQLVMRWNLPCATPPGN